MYLIYKNNHVNGPSIISHKIDDIMSEDKGIEKAFNNEDTELVINLGVLERLSIDDIKRIIHATLTHNKSYLKIYLYDVEALRNHLKYEILGDEEFRSISDNINKFHNYKKVEEILIDNNYQIMSKCYCNIECTILFMEAKRL